MVLVVAGALSPAALRAADDSDRSIAVSYDVGPITAAMQKDLGIDQSQAGATLVQIILSEARGAGRPLNAKGLKFFDGNDSPALFAAQTDNGHLLIRTILEKIGKKGIRHWHDEATPAISAAKADGLSQTLPDAAPVMPASLPATRATGPKHDGKQIQVEIVWMSIAPEQARQLLQSGCAVMEGNREAAAFAVFEQKNVEAAIAKMKEQGLPVHVMSSPVVVTPSGEEAMSEIGNTKEYLVGFKDGKPEKKNIFTGASLQTRPTLVGKDRVRVELHLAVAEPRPGEVVYDVRDPANGKSVQVKLPALAKTEVQTAVEMRLGQTVVLKGLIRKTGLDKSLQTVLMVRATMPTKQFKTFEEQEKAVTEGMSHKELSGTFNLDDGTTVVVEGTIRNKIAR
jgi:hypothetical protein